jgi:hypothetical protein
MVTYASIKPANALAPKNAQCGSNGSCPCLYCCTLDFPGFHLHPYLDCGSWRQCSDHRTVHRVVWSGEGRIRKSRGCETITAIHDAEPPNHSGY